MKIRLNVKALLLTKNSWLNDVHQPEKYVTGLVLPIMKNVVLYFPYILNLKAFVLTEKLNNIIIDPADSFLKTILNDDQIAKACSAYGAIIV
jgi:hypothetical protein